MQSLYSCGGGLAGLEHELLVLRQELQRTAQQGMGRGGATMQTLAIETELREVQQRAAEIQKKGKGLTEKVDRLIRSPSGQGGQGRQSQLRSELSHQLRQQGSPEPPRPEEMKEEVEKGGGTEEAESVKSMVTTSSSEESEETEEKYSQLVDLLTVKMFHSDKYGEKKTQTKSNSLPRSFEPESQSSLQKSNSQVWLSNVLNFFFV